MAKKFLKKLTNKGEAIKYQMERGLSNAQISKTLGIPESTIRYYRIRPKILEVKRNSKLPQKYINKICELESNKTTRENRFAYKSYLGQAERKIQKGHACFIECSKASNWSCFSIILQLNITRFHPT